MNTQDTRRELTDEQIHRLWEELPGIEIYNAATAQGMSFNELLRRKLARAVIAADRDLNASPAENFYPNGIAHLLPPITLNAAQLRAALEFVNPDGPTDVDQVATEVSIQFRLACKNTDGEDVPAGMCAWLTEYPEEGSLWLDPSPTVNAPADRDVMREAPVTVLPDGSAFFTGSFPLPKDHWLYAPRCSEWDSARDTTSDTPHPILTHEARTSVVAAVRYAVRGATMCGAEKDFDPDAIVQNAVYALCGPDGDSTAALNAPPADRTYDQENAVKEGHRNKIEDDYFDARPNFNQVHHRAFFSGGFDRGWDAAKKDAQAGRDAMRQAVTEEMAAAYLTASNRYWRETDKWRNGTALEATRVSLEAALAAAPADRGARRQTVEDIDAILYQCDRKTVSLPWLIDCLKGLKERAGAPTPPVEQPTKVETTYARQHAAHEAELTALIQERDHREEIIDQLCDAVLGPDRAEWSSVYYFEDAVSEVQERIAELETRKECRKSNMPAEQQEPAHDVLATLRAEVEALPRFSNSPEELYGLISNLAVLALIDKMGGKV